MTSFIVKQMVGGKLNEVTGGLNNLTGDSGEKTETGEDPEVIAARKEQEDRRKEKHRKMEAEREKMRSNIRDKYNIQKKDDSAQLDFGADGRIGASNKKTPEQLGYHIPVHNLAAEMQPDDSLIGQLGLTEQVETAKKAVTGAFETVKGFLPFGK